MKEIKAYIKPHKLSAVVLELHKIKELTGMSIVDVVGFGRTRGKGANHGIQLDLVEYVPHKKIELVCKDDLVNHIIEIIKKKAHTGLLGDGKIYVSTIDDAHRISTGETGESAV